MFFWDTSSDSKYTSAVRVLLALRTPNIKYRRVNRAQANPVTAKDKGGAGPQVGKLSKNSPTAVFLWNHALGIHTRNGLGMSTGKPVLATASSYVMDGLPILCDESVIGSSGFPGDQVLRPIIVAHEIGHKFQLEHYFDSMTNIPLPNPPSSLTFTQYALETPTSLLGRFTTYRNASNALVTGDGFVFIDGLTGHNQSPPYVLVGTEGQTDSILRFTFMRPIQGNAPVNVLRQLTFLMDYAHRFDQRTPIPPGVNDMSLLVNCKFLDPATAGRPSDYSLMALRPRSR